MRGAKLQFPSASTAGIVYAELGFIPDVAVLISNHGATNPDVYIWANNDSAADWAAAFCLKLVGAATVSTTARCLVRETSGITKYTGGDTIAAAENDNTAGKHVNLNGDAAAAGHVTAPGLAIPAGLQANSGANLLLALAFDSVPAQQVAP